MAALLQVQGLTVEYPGALGPSRVLDDVSFAVAPGEIVGLIGESGSGKSTAALAVLGLLPSAARVVAGAILFDGEDLMSVRPHERRRRLGRDMAYVPQEPLTALNPTLRVGGQIDLALARRFPGKGRAARRALAAAALEHMGIRDPGRILAAYPFELSGGQLQRALLAQAFALSPRLIIADEPTTALDVTVQGEVLGLLEGIVRETGAGVLFVSHNIAVVWRLCQQTIVLRAGRVVEAGQTARVISHPTTDYTRRLVAALPSLSAPRTPLPLVGGGLA